MNSILHDLIQGGKVVVYLDGILIFTKTLEEHRHIVQKVLDKLREHHLYLKIEKCTFEAREIDYLGIIIGNGTARMDPAKVKAIKEWPVLKTKKQLQAFLGFCNYYWRFIKDFSRICRPMYRLCGNTKWKWTEEQQKAFEKIRDHMVSSPVLALPRDEGE